MTRHVATALALMVMMVGSADAGLITFTETLTGSGTLDGTIFNRAAVTLTQTANTDMAGSLPRENDINTMTSSVTIDGVGTDSFLGTFSLALIDDGPDDLFVLFNAPKASGTTDILGNFETPLTYDFTTSIGPVSIDLDYAFPGGESTTRGSFELTSLNGAEAFTATRNVAVPEPSSWTLCGIAGVAGLGIRLARRRIA